MTQSEWSVAWSLDITSDEFKQLQVKAVVTYNGATSIEDVRMPFVHDEQGNSGEDHAVPIAVEPGMSFEVRYFLIEQQTWLQITKGMNVGDGSHTVLALFPNPFKRPASS